MTQTHSVSLGCPGCPKRSSHLFSPPNARADQRSARTRLASGDTSRALNNPAVVRTTGALDHAEIPHAFTAHPRRTPVYIRTRYRTRFVHIIFTPISAPTRSILATSTEKHAISKNRIVHVSQQLFAPSLTETKPLLILPQSCPSCSSCRKFPASSPSHLRTDPANSQLLAADSICTICIRRKSIPAHPNPTSSLKLTTPIPSSTLHPWPNQLWVAAWAHSWAALSVKLRYRRLPLLPRPPQLLLPPRPNRPASRCNAFLSPASSRAHFSPAKISPKIQSRNSLTP